jgi:hypothetical protein
VPFSAALGAHGSFEAEKVGIALVAAVEVIVDVPISLLVPARKTPLHLGFMAESGWLQKQTGFDALTVGSLQSAVAVVHPGVPGCVVQYSGVACVAVAQFRAALTVFAILLTAVVA